MSALGGFLDAEIRQSLVLKSANYDDHIFYVNASDYTKCVNVKPDAAYLVLKDGANILDSIVLKLSNNELLDLSSELNFPFTSKNATDSLNLSLTEFSAYYKNEARVGIKFTNTAKYFYAN